MMIEWTQKQPTVPGLYLRNNPGVAAVVRQPVYEIDGVLGTYDGEGNTILLDKVSPTFLWFGPIPLPTEEQQRQALTSGADNQ